MTWSSTRRRGGGHGTLAGDLILLGPDAVITGTVEGDVIGYASVCGSRVRSWETCSAGPGIGDHRGPGRPQRHNGESAGDPGPGGGNRDDVVRPERARRGAERHGPAEPVRHGQPLSRSRGGRWRPQPPWYDKARVLPGAVVRGASWLGDRPPVVDDGASVGEVRFSPRGGGHKPRLTMDGFALGRLAGFAAVGLLVTWLAPGLLGSFQRRVSGHFWATLAVGAGLLAGVPVLALVLMLTVGGIPAALMVVLPLYVVAIYLGQVFVVGLAGMGDSGPGAGRRAGTAVCGLPAGAGLPHPVHPSALRTVRGLVPRGQPGPRRPEPDPGAVDQAHRCEED